MHKKVILIWALFLIITSLSGCVYISNGSFLVVQGTGEMVSRDYTVDSFTKVNISVPLELVYSNQESDTVSIEIHENVLDYLRVEVVDGTLNISTTRLFKFNSGRAPKAYISAPTLESLKVSGAVVFKDSDVIESDSLTLDVDGACEFDLNVKTRRLTANCAGAGSLILQGETELLDISSAGAGSVDAMKLISRDTYITINGVGNVGVNCTGNLDVEINGLGNLEYTGNPAQVNKRINGLGTVRAV